MLGANGFVGSHLVDGLVSAGHEVTAFDRFSLGTSVYASSDVRPFVGDFLNRADLANALTGQDHVFHFLSMTDPATAENDPTLDIRTNVAASVELLELCVQAGIGKVFFASSGGTIYGDQAKRVLAETDPTLPVSPYAIGKLAIENYLRYFHAKFGLEYLVYRISNPYGPRQRPTKRQGVIPIFLRQISRDEPVTVFGDGGMVRDYLYVEDAARMMVAAVGAPAQQRVYNIGSGHGHSINEIIEVIREVTRREVVTRHAEVPSTYVDHITLDPTRYCTEFNVAASTPLTAGVEAVWHEIGEQHRGE